MSTTPLSAGVTRIHLDAPLTFQHFSGEESHGAAGRKIEMRAKVYPCPRSGVFTETLHTKL